MSETIQVSNYASLFATPRNVLVSKWDSIFETNPKEWISFRPALGLLVFPCYSCRHMFSSKKSFQDHVNRRAVVLQYKCTKCFRQPTLTFYNRCAFLIHVRRHFSLQQGNIDLDNLKIFSLPVGLAGFSRHPGIPYLYDVEQADYINNEETYINAQFYSPKKEDKGKHVITLTPSDLVINKTDNNGEIQALALKQVSRNIPMCQFVSLTAQKQLRQQLFGQEDSIKTETLDEEEDETIEETPNVDATNNNTNSAQEMTLPVITKIESVAPDNVAPIWPKCSECKEAQKYSMADHFLGENKPATRGLKCDICKLIATTKCSLKAHLRMHKRLPPFVCPECGKDFENYLNLHKHMDDVCFHLSKSIRYRCPGKKCGKLFAVPQTFGQHFTSHMRKSFRCSICQERFAKLDEIHKHAELEHNSQSWAWEKVFECGVCQDVTDLDESGFKAHVSWHANDRERCLFVYLCRFCKSYFRSTQTYATHLVKCSLVHGGKAKKTKSFESFSFSKYISGECEMCNNKIIYTKEKKVKICAKCSQTSKQDKCCCILCKKLITLEERKTHQKTCKYSHPRIMVEQMDLEEYQRSFSSNSSSSIRSSSPDSNEKKRRHSDENGLPKRKRSNNFSLKHSKAKKSENEVDMTADEPIRFTGTYQCRLCNFKETSRETFHTHVKRHRDSSTIYQCMECGECFVVKPSLIKHLLHYHNVGDIDEYFVENDCFDKTAVKELAEVVKLAPYVAKSTVKENQCKVCLEEFVNKEVLDKHFRVHGMAFLAKNSL